MPIDNDLLNRVNTAHTNMFNEEGAPQIDVLGLPIKAQDLDGIFCNWLQYSQTKFSIPLLSNILLMASDGAASDQAAIFQALLDKEPIISAHLQTRKTAIQSIDWSIMGDNEFKCQEIKKILQNAGIEGLKQHLLDAIGNGYSGAFIDWCVGPEGTTSIKSFTKINHTNWVFDRYGNMALVLRNGAQVPIIGKGKTKNSQQVIFHQYQMRSGIPSQGGVLRPLVWTYFFKHVVTKEQVRFLEKYGMPQLYASLSAADFENETIRLNIRNQLRAMAQEGVAIVTDKTKVESLQIPNASGGNADFLRFITHCNEVYALTILGQKASSGDASGMSRGQMQENVRVDILQSDCRSLSETINQQIIRPLEWSKYGTQECTFAMDFEEPANLKDTAEIVARLSSAGYKPKRSWVETTFKMPLEDEQPVQQLSMPNLSASTGGMPVASNIAPLAPSNVPSNSSTTNPSSLSPEVPADESVAMNDYRLKKKNLRFFADLDNEWHNEIDNSIDSIQELPSEIKDEILNPDLRGTEYNQHVHDQLTNTAIAHPEYAAALAEARQRVNSIDMSKLLNRTPNAPRVDVGEEETETPEQLAKYQPITEPIKPTTEEQIQQTLSPDLLAEVNEEPNLASPISQEAQTKSDTEQLEEAAKKYGINIHASTAVTRGNARSNLATEISWALIKNPTGEMTNEQLRDFKLLHEALGQQDIKATENSTWIGRQLSAVGAMLPSIIWGVAEAIPGAAAGFALGSAAPVVGNIGLGTLGAFQYWYRETQGNTFANMVFDEGVDQDTAKLAASLGAIPLTAINFLKLDKMARFIPGGTKVIDKLISEPIENVSLNVSRRVLKDYTAEFGKSAGINLSLNTLQSAIQEVVNESARAVSAKINDSDYSLDVKNSLQKIALNTMENFVPNMILAGAPVLASIPGYRSRILKADVIRNAANEAKESLAKIKDESIGEALGISDNLTKVKETTPDMASEPKEVKSTQPSPIAVEQQNALNKYLSDNPDAFLHTNINKDIKIEFASGDDARLNNAKGVFIPEQEGKPATICLNKDALTTPQEVINVLAHEDFGHRFLDTALDAGSKSKIYDTLNKLINNGDKSFWSDKTQAWYENRYRNPEFKLTEIQVQDLINEEKLTNFLEKGGYEKLDKASIAYQPIQQLITWVRVNLANLFGKSTDTQVLNFLSDTFKKYRDNEVIKPVEQPTVSPEVKPVVKTQPIEATAELPERITENKPVIPTTEEQQPSVKKPTINIAETFKNSGRKAIQNLNELYQILDGAVDRFTEREFPGRPQVAQNLKNALHEIKSDAIDFKEPTQQKIVDRAINSLQDVFDKTLNQERQRNIQGLNVLVSKIQPKELYKIINPDKEWNDLSPKEQLQYKNMLQTGKDISDLQSAFKEANKNYQTTQEEFLTAVKSGVASENLEAAKNILLEKVTSLKEQLNEMGLHPDVTDFSDIITSLKPSIFKSNIQKLLSKIDLSSLTGTDRELVREKLKGIVNKYKDSNTPKENAEYLIQAKKLLGKTQEDNTVKYKKILVDNIERFHNQAVKLIRSNRLTEEGQTNLELWREAFNPLTDTDKQVLADLHERQAQEEVALSIKETTGGSVDIPEVNPMQKTQDYMLLMKEKFGGRNIKNVANIDLQDYLNDFYAILSSDKPKSVAEREAKVAQDSQLRNDVKDALSQNKMGSDKPLKPEDIPTESGRIKAQSISDKLKFWAVQALRKEDICLWLSAFKEDSVIYKNTIGKVLDSVYDQRRRQEDLLDTMRDIFGVDFCKSDMRKRTIELTVNDDAYHKFTEDKQGKKTYEWTWDSKPVFEPGKNEWTVKLSPEELMHIYANAQSDSGYHKLIASFFDATKGEEVKKVALTPDFIDSINKTIRTKDFVKYADMVDKLISYYDNVQYPEMNKVYRAVFGYDMAKEPNYFPQNNLDFKGLGADMGIIEAQALMNTSKRVAKCMTIERDPQANLGFKDFNFFDVVEKNAQQVTYYLAWEQTVRDLNKLLGDKDIQNMMDKILPGSSKQLTTEWIPYLARGFRPTTPIDKVMSTLRNIESIAVLGLKVMPVLVQIPYSIFSRGETPLVYSLKGIHDFAGDIVNSWGTNTWNDVINKSEFMKTRWLDNIRHNASPFSEQAVLGFNHLFDGQTWSDGQFKQFINELQIWKTDKRSNLISQATQAMFIPMAFMEQAMSVQAWDAHYKYLTETKVGKPDAAGKIYTSADAVKACDTIIRGTQPFFDIRLNSSLNNCPLYRAFSLFKGSQAQLMSNLVTKIAGAVYEFKHETPPDAGLWQRGGQVLQSERGGYIATRLVGALVAGSIAEQLVRSSFTSTPFNELEETLRATLNNTLGGEAISGSLLDAGMERLTNIIKSKIHGTEPEKNVIVDKNDNILSYYMDIAKGIVNHPDVGNKWLALAKNVLPIATPAMAIDNANMRNVLFNSNNALDKVKAFESFFMSGYSLRFKRDYPLSFILGEDYTNLDSLITHHNNAHPDTAWYPQKISDKLNLKNNVSVQLSSSEYDTYLSLINQYMDDSNIKTVFSMSVLDDNDIHSLKNVVSRAKSYAVKTLINSTDFTQRHLTEIQKASGQIE